VYGTWTLCELLKDRPDALFVTFSSINGLFGGASFSSYSAANSFQEAFTLDRRNRCLPRSYCFNWTMWDSVGMSAGAPEFVRQASRSMGYHILSPKEALQSFHACLTCDPGQVIIGVDASNPHMRKNILADSPSLEHLAIYYTGDREAVQRELSSARLMDRFGIRVVFSPIHLDALPLTPDGDIDRELLSAAASGRSGGTARRTEAGTETEHRVTELWREVLQSAHVNADDDFFQIGGDSLHAMRLLNRIQETFGVRLPLRVLFDDATVRGLSRIIEQEQERPGVPDVLPTVETQPTGLLAKLDQLSDADVATLLTRLAATNDR